MKNAPLYTPAARRHLRLLLGAVRPMARRLDRQFRALLRERPYDRAQIEALAAITPAAASRSPKLDGFRGQVEHYGQRLARLNLPLSEVGEMLGEFAGLLERATGGTFAPAREQLHLVTRLWLAQAYYNVREAECQALFGLTHVEAEAKGLDDLLARLVGVLARTFQATSGRLLLLDAAPAGKLARPLYICRGSRDERLIQCDSMRGKFACYWSFPIRGEALLQLGFGTANPWLPRQLAMLAAAGARCFEALERARMQGEVQRLAAEARRAEDQERRRLGRDLHDEAGQSLVLLRLQLEMMERDAPEALRPRLTQARMVTERTVDELRRTIAALSPMVVERLGIRSALRQLATRFRRQLAGYVSVRLSPKLGRATLETQEVIYRVSQEALQNIFKHSQASEVKILVVSDDKKIRLSVRDNGCGFDPAAARGKPLSFGLACMQERAALLGGKLKLRSARGKGAAVILELPPTYVKVPGNVKNQNSTH